MSKKIIPILSLFFCVFINIILDLNIQKYISLLENCFNRIIIIDTKIYIIIFLIIALISILTYLAIYFLISKREIKNKTEIMADDGTYGTSDWMSEKDIRKTFQFGSNQGILLGKWNNEIVSFDSPFYNKNVTVVGPSGSR